MSYTFRKATKSTAKLRAALFGPSGAGKTYTALRIATGLGGPIAVVDTERGSASKYADRFTFDVLDLGHAEIPSYQGAIAAAAAAGYPVLVIDSLSHGWQELLQEIDRLAVAKYRGNTWSAWAEGTPKQRALVDAILGYPGHVIATMRSKTEWSVESDGKGRQKPVRIGLAPEQGKGIEYEFDLLLELSPEHLGLVLKDRTGRFQDAVIERPGEEFGQALAAWLAAPAPEVLSPAEPKAATKRSRKAAGRDEPPAVIPSAPATQTDAPEPVDAAATWGEIASPATPIAEAVQEQVERLVLRAAKVGAWTQARDYCRERFAGAELDYALNEIANGEEAAQQSRAERPAAA